MTLQREPQITTFYNSKAWKRCRANYRQSVGGLCEDCLAKGIYTPGEIVHHIEHVTMENVTNPEVTLNPKNLRLVCMKCHADEHPELYGRKRARRYIVEDGKVKIKK